MSYKEKDIKHEAGSVFVLDCKYSYGVFVTGITHATSDSFYKRDADGLSIAIARANYLSKRKGEVKP